MSPPPPITPDDADAIRHRVISKHRAALQDRLDAIRRIAIVLRDDIKAHVNSHNAALSPLVSRLELVEGAIAVLQREVRGDDTTIGLPILREARDSWLS